MMVGPGPAVDSERHLGPGDGLSRVQLELHAGPKSARGSGRGGWVTDVSVRLHEHSAGSRTGRAGGAEAS